MQIAAFPILLFFLNNSCFGFKFEPIRIAASPHDVNDSPTAKSQDESKARLSDITNSVVKPVNTFFGVPRHNILGRAPIGSKPSLKTPQPDSSKIRKVKPAKQIVREDTITTSLVSKPVQSFRRKINRGSVLLNTATGNDLQKVAQSMKAVVSKKIQPPVSHQPEQSGSVVQGFKVEGDPSNKIVFIDLEALRSAGISLDSPDISLGSSRFGENFLKPIEGLKTGSSNFQSVTQQNIQAEPHRSRIPSQPRHSVQQVAPSHSRQVLGGGDQRALSSSFVTKSNQAGIPSRQQPSLQQKQSPSPTPKQQQPVFFNKFQNGGNYAVQNQRKKASPAKTSTLSLESFSNFPSVGKSQQPNFPPVTNFDARKGKTLNFEAKDDSLETLASLTSSRSNFVSGARNHIGTQLTDLAKSMKAVVSQNLASNTVTRARSHTFSHTVPTTQKISASFQVPTITHLSHQEFKPDLSTAHGRDIQAVLKKEEELRSLTKSDQPAHRINQVQHSLQQEVYHQPIHSHRIHDVHHQDVHNQQQELPGLQQHQEAIRRHQQQLQQVKPQQQQNGPIHSHRIHDVHHHDVHNHQQELPGLQQHQEAVRRHQQQLQQVQPQQQIPGLQQQQDAVLRLQQQQQEVLKLQQQTVARDAQFLHLLTPFQAGLAQHNAQVAELKRAQASVAAQG